MKNILLGLLLVLMLASCISTTTPKVAANKSPAKELKQKNIDPYKLIVGTWKIESYQVYSVEPDPTEDKNISWEFNDKNEVTINSITTENATMNTYPYWMNKSILNVDQQLYMFYFEEPLGISRGANAKPFGDELWLDTNLDPSVSDHGPKIHLVRVK